MITEWDLIRSLLDLQHSRRDLFPGTGDSPALSWLTMMRSKTRKGYSSETVQQQPLQHFTNRIKTDKQP